MDRIDRLLPSSIRKAGAAGTVKAAMIVETASTVLSELFGAEMAASMKPTTFKNGTLTLRCSRAAYAQEIALHEVDLLNALAQRLGPSVVKRLRPVS